MGECQNNKFVFGYKAQCQCNSGFTGDHCDQEINLCQTIFNNLHTFFKIKNKKNEVNKVFISYIEKKYS